MLGGQRQEAHCKFKASSVYMVSFARQGDPVGAVSGRKEVTCNAKVTVERGSQKRWHSGGTSDTFESSDWDKSEILSGVS